MGSIPRSSHPNPSRRGPSSSFRPVAALDSISSNGDQPHDGDPRAASFLRIFCARERALQSAPQPLPRLAAFINPHGGVSVLPCALHASREMMGCETRQLEQARASAARNACSNRSASLPGLRSYSWMLIIRAIDPPVPPASTPRTPPIASHATACSPTRCRWPLAQSRT